jgi:AraC-like DNA-binding protein
MSPRHFTRVFTIEVGEAPGAYVERIRTEAARRQLEETDDTVTVIASRCGFGTAETLRHDPQPPFDSGHMSKSSIATKAAATALLSKDVIKPAQLKATTMLLWDGAIKAARSRHNRGRRRQRGLGVVGHAQRD